MRHVQRPLGAARHHLLTVLGISAALLITGCAPSMVATSSITEQPERPAASSSNVTSPPSSGSPSLGDAATELDRLPVKGRAPMTGYDRDAFGPSWKDMNRNGCDTRNDILSRDLVERQMQDSCIVLSGVLYPDPYTAENITFVRGKSLVDIDHVVALGNAWVTGAFQWDAAKRESFANDPLNLLAVSASANRQKSDGDAATWLPSNKAYRCSYVSRQIAVKAAYGLWVTQAEKSMMATVLSSCPGQPLPATGLLPEPVPTKPGNEPTREPAPSVKRFTSCAAAREAGVTPIVKATNPELYEVNKRLDGDRDGVACE